MSTLELWCVRLAGPDDLIAQPNRDAAEAYAQSHRATIRKLLASDPSLAKDGITETSMQAFVEPWPWSADAHAEALNGETAL